MGTDTNTRLYGSAIAIVSGLYAIASPLAAQMPMMGAGQAALGMGGWIMLVIGVVVFIHGIVLLTPVADRLGGVSGPLMIAWSVVMLLNQALLATMPGFGMGAADGMMRSPVSAGMGWDAGMVAIAILMLVSGLIMTRGPSTGRM